MPLFRKGIFNVLNNRFKEEDLGLFRTCIESFPIGKDLVDYSQKIFFENSFTLKYKTLEDVKKGILKKIDGKILELYEKKRFKNIDESNFKTLSETVRNAVNVLSGENEDGETYVYLLNMLEEFDSELKKNGGSERLEELYDEIKKEIFMFHKDDYIAVRQFSLIRKEYKKTLFKSTENLKELYGKKGIEKIVLDVRVASGNTVEKYTMKFDGDSRTFILYNENGIETASVPVSKVLNMERTEFKEIPNIREYFKKDRESEIRIVNVDAANKIMSLNVYPVKSEDFNTLINTNEISKTKKDILKNI